MFRNGDVIRKFLFPCRILPPARLHQKDSADHRYLSVFHWKYQRFLREIFNLLTKVFFSRRSASNVFCKDWINSVCAEIVLFSWLIMSLYARIFESFELPAICLLLLFHCSYYTIKSNEKEAENPVFTRDCRHDTGCGKLSIFVSWHRVFTRSFRRFECLWLFDFKTGHEPVNPAKSVALLPTDFWASGICPGLPYVYTATQIRQIPRAKLILSQRFPTEKIQGASPWIHMELILYNSTQPVNRFPHIRSACYDIDFIGGCDIP